MNKAVDTIRGGIKGAMHHIAKIINNVSRGKITPNMITIIGLLAHFYIAWLIAGRSFIVSAILLVIFGLFDSIDGALARLQGTASQKGMLLDSVTDRIKETVLFTGIAYALIVSEKPFYAVWAVLACGLSIIVSYVNAWGEVVASKSEKLKPHSTNQTFRAGIMSYDVRMFTLVVGLLSGYLTQSVIIIALLSFITIIERFRLITNKLE